MREEIKLLLERGKYFFELAKKSEKDKQYEMAMFCLEQAIQLIVKAKLLDLTGFFEKTHKLSKLLHDLSKVMKKRDIKEVVSQYKRTIAELERAYISSRYLPETFDKESVEKAKELYQKLIGLLWKS